MSTHYNYFHPNDPDNPYFAAEEPDCELCHDSTDKGRCENPSCPAHWADLDSDVPCLHCVGLCDDDGEDCMANHFRLFTWIGRRTGGKVCACCGKRITDTMAEGEPRIIDGTGKWDMLLGKFGGRAVCSASCYDRLVNKASLPKGFITIFETKGAK